MANIIKPWKRIVAVGCSHGEHLAADMRAAVLGAIDRYAPHYRVHLGDAMDTTAFRAGARGNADETAPIAPDIDAGLCFLRDMRATHYALGNHEDRIWRLRADPNAIKAHCAARIVDQITTAMGRLRCALCDWHIMRGWFDIGGVKWGHGYIYGENYLRDSAERFGSCVVAHGHRSGHARGRRLDEAQCWGVGTLAEIANMDYAKSKASTLAWSAGIVWGEVCKTKSALWLAEIGPDRRMPF